MHSEYHIQWILGCLSHCEKAKLHANQSHVRYTITWPSTTYLVSLFLCDSAMWQTTWHWLCKHTWPSLLLLVAVGRLSIRVNLNIGQCKVYRQQWPDWAFNQTQSNTFLNWINWSPDHQTPTYVRRCLYMQSTPVNTNIITLTGSFSGLLSHRELLL